MNYEKQNKEVVEAKKGNETTFTFTKSRGEQVCENALGKKRGREWSE